MKPTTPVLPSHPEFPEMTLAKDQPEYEPLPVCVIRYGNGDISTISRWRFTWRERLRVLFTGTMWLEQLTFGSRLQPQLPHTREPLT